MIDIARILAETGQRTLVVPRPHPELVTRRVLVMERLSGFGWDDAAGMHAAGIDTQAVVRAGLVAFLEGAMLYGVFHGDLHGGNLFVQPDGRVALLDYGITGRLDEPRRLAFMRLLVGGTVSDVRAQLAALRDLGALPPELVGQIRDLTKALLAYGARLPKELMLFVKNMLFLDASLANLAPDVDLFAEISYLAQYFAVHHGERILADVGFDPRRAEVDLTGFKASLGVDEDTHALTHRELQQRRELIRRRFQEREQRRDRGRSLRLPGRIKRRLSGPEEPAT
jgi:ubiquinone biosynthesis protein